MLLDGVGIWRDSTQGERKAVVLRLRIVDVIAQ